MPINLRTLRQIRRRRLKAIRLGLSAKATFQVARSRLTAGLTSLLEQAFAISQGLETLAAAGTQGIRRYARRLM
jgi:hypothetical protein